ncbi:hypothetical protein CAEBREN_31493 [Caenorhabditis brenneri]|uniref:PH domain-containing protein n=1 Tax=Caenorhabditis brenneri TaxID=135651 RepID=G0N600_CAEBE|nr:hypothetical protein CAEBREN_31493 [Caenorhabditis brenneri]
MDNQFDSIMERIRTRQNEMSGSEEAKENEKAPQTSVTKQGESSATKVFGTSSKVNDPSKDTAGVYFRPAEPKETTPKSSTSSQEPENKTSTAKKPSRFSILAQEQEEFESDYTNPYNRPKEAFMKGRSPRMSIGEIRPAVLCTPAGAASIKSPNVAKSSEVSKNGPEIALGMSDFEARRIKFAQPIVNVNYLPNESSIFSGGSSSANDMSTVLGGSAEMMNVTTSSLSCGETSLMQHVTNENTLINAQSCDNREAILRDRVHMENASIDEYGAHTFMRKKVPKKAPEPSTIAPSNVFTKPTNIHTLVSSPKPYSKDVGRAIFSPVHFTPKSTSSPKTIQTTTTTTDTIMSPSKIAALEGSVATTRRMQFEQQLKKNNTNLVSSVPAAPIPTPRHVLAPSAIQSTPHHPYTAQQKKNLFPPSASKTATTTTMKTTLAAKPLVATAPIPVQTQWRGQSNTPVVQGARAEDKTAGDQLVGAGVGKLKNLKSRWEFCSATGTPIHPDATEDSLIATAMKMKESAIPKQIGHRSAYGRKGPSASSLHSQQSDVRSTTASPASKNIRYGQEEYEDEEDDNVFEEESRPQSAEHDEISVMDDIETDTSRFIDNAFGFMEGPGTGTPSPFREAPLAKEELLFRKRTEVIEEEDIQDNSSEEDNRGDEIGKAPEVVPEETPIYNNKKANDSGLAYSVSFYRKFQRERVGENATLTPLASLSPSAPVASLTSPQKLKQLTSSYDGPAGGRIMESEQETMRRIHEASKIEEEQISQSQRALARARDQPSFRGSREEFEAQRALLVHVEKHRAMNVELCRLKKEGARIVDGPRGTLSIMQLSVQLDREFVKNYIEAPVKPEEVFYFVAILRYADQVDVSKMVTSDNGVNRRGTLDFPTPMKLTAIPPDFRATLEIYGQRSVRESTTHEDKFKLKSTTLKAKVRPGFLGGSTSSGNQSLFGSSSNKDKEASSIHYYDPNATRFNLLASISFDINCRGKTTYNLPNLVYPLAAELQMKVKKEAVDGADIVFRGFLSMYQRTNEGLGSWTRYWCVLENGEMKFWRQPEDEGHKSYLVLMDLSTCCKQEGASTVNDICPFPNSFHIDVWAPKDDPNEPRGGGIMQLRVMLAADTAQDLQKWLSVINSTSRQLCTWRNPIQL